MAGNWQQVGRLTRRYVAPYLLWYVLGTLFIAGSHILMVGIIESTKKAIDAAALPDAVAGTVTPFTWRITLFALSLMVVWMLSRLLIFTPGRKIEYAIRDDYFARLVFLQRDFFSAHVSGDLVSRCSSDIDSIRMAYGFGIMQITKAVIAFCIAVTAMVHMDVTTTLCLAIPVVLLSTLIQITVSYLMPYWELSNRQRGEISAMCLASYRGVAVVQAYHAEPAVERRFAELNREYLNTHITTLKVRTWVFPLIHTVGDVAMLLIIYLGGREVIAARLTFGEITAFLGYIAMLMPPMLSLGWILYSFQQARPAADRLCEILNATPAALPVTERLDHPVCGQTALRAEGLSFEYGKGDPHSFALRNIYFDLPPGKVLGIVGELGSGKTTLVETLLRLNFLESGQLWVNGKDAAHCDLCHYRRYFSFAPQKAFLFSASIRDNLKVALPLTEWHRKDLDEMFLIRLRLAGFEMSREQFSAGLSTVVGEKGIMLSGGQRQRIALARALIKEADIYILDDVLSAVDYETEQHILQNLRNFVQGKSFIIVSHRISAVRWADEILVLKEGEIVDRGSHEELVSRPGYYQEIWHCQS